MIYFVQAKDGAIKIGHSGTDVRRRIAGLKTSTPGGLTCLGVIEGDASDEKKLHAQFKQFRISGEWHKPAPRLLQFIRINAGPLAPPARKPKPVNRPKPKKKSHAGRTPTPWRNATKGNAWYAQVGGRKIRLAESQCSHSEAQEELAAILEVVENAPVNARRGATLDSINGWNFTVLAMGI